MTNGVDFPDPTPSAPYRDDRMRFWDNDGGRRFDEVAVLAGVVDTGSGKGLLTFDYDRDGDLDIFVVNNGGVPRLYRNDGGSGGAWLRVRLLGAQSNHDGLGARIRVAASADGVEQILEIGAQTHFLGQSERTAHFGLEAAVDRVARVTVVWPATGIRTVLANVPANATIAIIEGEDGYSVLPFDAID